MTEVAFHFNMPDKTLYMCRLLRKAVAQGAQVAVSGDDSSLLQLDQALWSFSATDFVPHCRGDGDARIKGATPVVLTETVQDAGHHDVLLNLHAQVPAGFERFARVIEVVGDDASEREDSRARWKYYQSRGYAIVRHDLAESGAV